MTERTTTKARAKRAPSKAKPAAPAPTPALAALLGAAIRAAALDPWKNWAWKSEPVPEWGCTVRVRALSSNDWIDYNALADKLTPKVAPPAEGEEPAEVLEVEPGAYRQVLALALVRTLYDEDGQRVLSDDDIPTIAANYSPVHDRLTTLAFQLSGVQAGTDPVETAGND